MNLNWTLFGVVVCYSVGLVIVRRWQLQVVSRTVKFPHRWCHIVSSCHLTSVCLSSCFAPVVLSRILNLHCDSLYFPSFLNHFSLFETQRRHHLAKAALMYDAWQGDGVIVAGVQCDERINGSSRLMEGGGPTCSPLSGARCNRAGRKISGWAVELFFMFWMSPCSFLPTGVGMIWMSLAMGMLLKHEVHPAECIIVIQLTASVLCFFCREAADVRHDNSPDKQLQFT